MKAILETLRCKIALKRPLQDLLVIGAFFFLTVPIAYYAEWIRPSFGGDEFSVFQYANYFKHSDAWLFDFQRNGRLGEALYWNYFYELIGFNPRAVHTSSLILHWAGAFLASFCFLRAWPAKSKIVCLSVLMFGLFYLNPISLDLVSRVQNDNSRLSILFFFLAGIFLQNWAMGASKNPIHLFFSALAFAFSVLTYENTAFLFPALILLNWTLLNKHKKNLQRYRSQLLVFGCLVSLFAFLPLLVTSFGGGQNHLVSTHLDQRVLNFPERLFDYLSGLAHLDAFNNPRNGFLVAIAIYFTVTLSAFNVRTTFSRDSDTTSDSLEKSGFRSLILGSLWIVFIGALPFALADYPLTSRVLSSAIFGLPPLMLLLSFNGKRNLFTRILALSFIALTLFSGISRFHHNARTNTAEEAQRNDFFLNMKAEIPAVKPGTEFIFIDFPLHSAACEPSMNMLYDAIDLRCGLINSADSSFFATRFDDSIQIEKGGWFRDENWIVILVSNQSEIEILPELGPDDIDLPILWISQNPITTDYRRILYFDVESEFYQYLLMQDQLMDQNAP